MRNLKRVLSLALACVMVIGMMVMTTGAADFTDKAEIEYTEAVEVAAALGLIEGIEAKDGTFSFNPDGILTREGAAKLICYMLMGPENAEKLVGTSNFTDVKATRWSAPYISYCVSLGYIAGNGDGTFNPTGKLTGVAFAKLLLCALGYDPEIEGYVNNKNYATNIGTDAIEAGLAIKGVDLSAQLTREQAAQMILNTMKATMVGYTGGMNITTSDGTSITVDSTRYKQGDPSETTAFSYTGVDNTPYTQFCEKNFAKLKKAAGDVDAFGRPASHKWTLDGKTVCNVMETPVLTYTADMTAAPKVAVVTKALKDYTYDTEGTDASKWIDGVETADDINSAAEVAALTGNGKVVEVYADNNKVVTDVVVVNTYVGTIATHTDAVKDTDGEITAKEFVTITEGHTNNPDGANSNKFETTAFAEADEGKTVVLYTVATVDTDDDDVRDTIKVQSVAVADKVEDVAVKAYDANSITTDTKYALSANVGSNLDTTPTMTGGATYTYYFDAYGNIIDGVAYTSVNTSIDGIVYATAAKSEAAVTADGTVHYVKIVHLDGTKETIATTSANAAAVTGAGFYMMSKDNTGKMKFEAAADNKLLTDTVGHLDKATNELYTTDAITIAEANTKVFKTNDNTLTLDGAGKAYLTSDTRYVFINAKNQVEVVTGGISTSITGATGDSTYTVLVSKNDTVNLEVEAIIFAGLGYNEISSSDAIVYVNSNTASGKVLAGTAEYSTYDIYALDGTKTSVPMASQPDANAFYTYKTDAAGVYTLTKITTAPAATGTSVYYASNATATTYGTLLSVDDAGADFADKEAANAVIIDLDNAAEVSTLKDITSATALDAGFLFVNGKITTIFVTDVD